MIKIDLITGFLGSGKTTFIRKYVNRLCSQGQRVCILENDFGAVNVDMMLLQDLLGDSCDLEMVSGAYDKDCHKRRFKTKLISMAMRGFDRVVIEPSGIYDTDEFFDTLREEPLDNWYELGNVIAICDAGLDENLSENAEYFLSSQLVNAGKIILSRCQTTSPEIIESTVLRISRLCEGSSEKILCADWDKLTDEEWSDIFSCGYTQDSFEKKWLDEKKAFDSLYFMNVAMSEEQMREKTAMLFGDKTYGNVFRVKGFTQTSEGWVELNATQRNLTVQPIEKGQQVVIVIGEQLNEEKIRNLWEK